MSIRPISRKLPTSIDIWEETYLPLCVVVTPMEEIGDDDDVDDNEAADGLGTFSQPMAAVPKCLTCGAPLPTSTTHFRPSNRSKKILCYLCGEVSSILHADQQELRDSEYLDPDVYEKVAFLSPQEKKAKNKELNGDEEDDLCYDFSTDTIDFRHPIIAAKAGDDTSQQRNGMLKKNLLRSAPEPTWQLPAMACPPIWWILVDGTVGNTTSIGATQNYWSTVGSLLSKTLDEIPPHVHVGLITATGSRLCSWDLTSAVPHARQYSYEYDPADVEAVTGGGDGQTTGDDTQETSSSVWDLCLVPANGHYKANLEAAIRAMVDGAISGMFVDDSNDSGEEKKGDDAAPPYLMPLGLTLEILLEFMEEAVHPTNDVDDEEDGDYETNEVEINKLRYAGGKILCLLGNPPLETGDPPKSDSLSYMGQSNFGAGGLAGACRSIEPGHATRGPRASRLKSRKDNSKAGAKTEDDAEMDPTDLTPSNLEDYVSPLDPDNIFVKIGFRCAKAALGVDLIVLVPEEDDEKEMGRDGGSQQPIPWYGLPLLRPLSDASGAPGPLMFGTANIGVVEDMLYSNEFGEDKKSRGWGFGKGKDSSSAVDHTKSIKNFERLFENILSRTPWQSGMVFGARMKLRLSPGLTVDETPIKAFSKGKIELVHYLYSKGLTGAAVSVNEDKEDEGKKSSNDEGDVEEHTWMMGSCDSYASLNIELQINGELPDSVETEEFGLVALKPVMQTCTLYTCVEMDDSGDYFTVCKIRVSSVALEIGDDVEAIYNGLDSEAMIVILFNKMVLDAYMTGFRQVQDTAESWLIQVMLAVYQAAKAEKARLEEDRDLENTFNFVSGDRLLDENGGSLEDEDIMVGEGHFKMKLLALSTYAVLQCEALRPCESDSDISMDARLCAITQMSSMTPSALVSTLAPSLSLWSLKDDEAIIDPLPLSREGILDALENLGAEITEDTVLLLESTRGVLLFDAADLKEETTTTAKRPITVGPKFQSAVVDAFSVHRTSPYNWKPLEDLLSNNGKGDLNEIRVPASVLRSMLVEDMPTCRGDRNFTEWKSKIAESIFEDIEVIKEIEKKEEAKRHRKGMMRFGFGKK